MNKYTFLFLLMIAVNMCCKEESGDSVNLEPKKYDFETNGLIPDENTAIKIAEAILPVVYGKSILEQKPYVARLVGDTVWIVEGTFKSGGVGGTARIDIKKMDCTITKVTHGK